MTRNRRTALTLGSVLLFLLAACSDSEDSAAPTDTPSTQTSAAAATTLDVTIEGDSVTPTGETLEAGPGDTIALHIVSDRPGELHVHSSPEQEIPFDEGESTVTFTVDKPGVVDVEEHETEMLIAKVLVT